MNAPTYLYKAGHEPIIVDASEAQPFLADGWKDSPAEVGEITNGKQESATDEEDTGEDAAKGRKKRVLSDDDSN